MDSQSRTTGYARSALVREARSLLADAIRSIAASKERKHQSDELLESSRQHLRWSDDLIGESQPLVVQLRKTITAIALTERASSAPPEKVLTLLKSLVADAQTTELEPAQARSLTEDIVRWGIEAYYTA